MINILAAVGLYAIACWLYGAYRHLFGDREGNSGRYKHWGVE